MTDEKYKKIMKTVVPLFIALISVLVISRFAASTEFHAKTISALDDKKTTVMRLTAAATATSAAITLIPGDTGTPIAEKIADLSTYFLVVLCAIYLEKYLVTILGYAAFTILIPAACILLSVSVFNQNGPWKNLAKRLAILGIASFLIIPTSVKVSDLIENTYESSIEETIQTAQDTTQEIEGSSEDNDEGVSGFISGVTDGLSDITAKIENVLNNFIEALAVMLVTSCVIPVIVLLFFIWLVKTILNIHTGKVESI